MFFRRRGRGTRFRRRGGRRFKRRVTGHPHYINVALRTLTNGTADPVTLIAAKDSPDSTLLSDGTTGAECENDSIVRGRLTLCIAKSSGSTPQTISYMILRDKILGGVTQSTDPATTILGVATTEAKWANKKNTIAFRRFVVNANTDQFTFHHRITGFLRDGESIKIIVFADSVVNQVAQWTAYGRLWSRQR